MPIRSEYKPVKANVEAAGYFVTSMPLDSGGDRIVCAGMRRPEGGYTGNSFWLAERNGKWFLGAWSGALYRLADVRQASEVSLAWLKQNSTRTAWDVPSKLRSQFGLVPADDAEFERA